MNRADFQFTEVYVWCLFYEKLKRREKQRTNVQTKKDEWISKHVLSNPFSPHSQNLEQK